MSVVIRGFNKPKNCYSCHFNDNNCWCSITKGAIDRDDYTCNVLCPIEQLPKVEVEDKEMTREEAIAILIRELNEDPFWPTKYRQQIHEALRMGIEALEHECTSSNAIARMPLPQSHKAESEVRDDT